MLPLIGGAVVFLGALYGFRWTAGQLGKLDRLLLDEYHLHGRRTPARSDIMLLAVDDDSVTRAQAWPEDIAASPALQAMEGKFTIWPRRLWAMTLDRLFQAGAREVFLDLTFFGKTTPEDDQALADAVRRYRGKLVLGAKFNADAVSKLDYPDPVITGVEGPGEEGIGFLNFWPESGITRRARYQTTRWKVEGGVPDPTERPIPSVALALARRMDVSASAEVSEWERLRFCRMGALPVVSLHHIFVPDLWKSNFGEGAIFKDKVVLVGVTLQEAHDIQYTPVGVMNGVELHAHALTALLAHSFLRDAPAWWPWLGLALGAVIAWLLASHTRHPVLTLFVILLVTAGAVWISFLFFNDLDLEASPLPFVFALNGCGIVGLAGNFLGQLRETRRITRILQRYHSPDRVAHLLRDRENLFQALGGVGRTVTVLFSDIRGFTSLSEDMKPEELVTQLNEYLSGMVEKVFVHQGSIDKFIGDAVMALWGSLPEFSGKGQALKQDARLAVASALDMRERLAALNQDWRARDMPELRIGIGIHQGPVVVGHIGSASPYERMEFTVIGDSVNLASRLEGLTKDYGCDLIVSDAVQQHLLDTHLCRPLDFVKVKGKAIPVKIYSVIGPRDGHEPPAWWAVYEEGIQAFRSGDKAKARDFFERCQVEAGDDALVRRFLKECAE